MKNNKGKIGRKFIIIIMVLLIIVISLLNKNVQSKILDFVNSFKTGEKTLLLTNSLENHKIVDINIYKNTIVEWKDNSLIFMKVDGDLILEEQFDFLDPTIYYGEKHIYPFDKATGDIFFFKENGQNLGHFPLGKEVFNVKEIKGHLLCHSKTDKIERIDILDKDRILIGNPTFENENILAYDIDKKGSKILISVLNLKDGILKSEIHYFGENNEKKGFLTIEEEIILFNEIISNDEEIVLTDKSLYYLRNREIVWEKSFNLIKDTYIMKDTIYLLHGNYLKSINIKGEVKNEIAFTKDYNRIIDFNGSTLLYGDESLAIIKSGESVIEVEESILKVYTNGRDIIVLGPDILNVYRLVNIE